ncbi:MAG: hypothetical protein ACJAXM_001242 [Arenicella sp.]
MKEVELAFKSATPEKSAVWVLANEKVEGS